MLQQLLEALSARQSRPLNCAVIGANFELAELIGSPEENINQIAVNLPCWDDLGGESEALAIYPTGWADLIIVNFAIFAAFKGIQLSCLWREMVRIAARQGVMLALLPESGELSLAHSDLAMVQGVLAPYVQSYGTDPWPEGKCSVHWALRNTRVFSPETLRVDGRDLSLRSLNDGTDQVIELEQQSPNPAAPNLFPRALDVQSGQMPNGMQPVVVHVHVNESATIVDALQKQLEEQSKACRLAEDTIADLHHHYTGSSLNGGAIEKQDVRDDLLPSPAESSVVSDSPLMQSAVTPFSPKTDKLKLRQEVHHEKLLPSKAYVSELETTIGRLQRQLEEKTELCRQADVDLDALQDRHFKLRLALAIGDSQEIQDIIADDPLTQIAKLREQLAEMTASYLDMSQTVSALTSSRFWRITWIPRRLLDRFKSYLRPPVLLAAPEPSAIAIASPSPVISSTVTDICSDQPRAKQLDYPDWQQLWTGSFLKTNGVVTSITQPRLDRILFVDWRLPEPDQDSGSCRIIAILEMAVKLGLRVDFISDSENQQERYRDLLLDLGIHIIAGRTNAVQHLQRFGSHYRQCFVSRPEPASYYLPLIRCFCAEAQLIYDTVDLHFSRFLRGSSLTSLSAQEREELLNLHYQYKVAESFLARSADLVVVVTEAEKNELMPIVPAESVVVIPNIHPLPDLATLPSLDTRKGLLFVGGFDHAPNVDAVLYFCEQILPHIVSEIPDVIFHIVGSRMTDVLYALEGPNVNPVGFVDDLRTIYGQTRVFVAPLRYGAGLKGKVGQSMSFGVPVVGTEIAFEGYSLVDHHEGLIASDSSQFAKAVIKLYRDPSLWQHISTQAWGLIEKRFSTQAVQHSVQSLLQTST